MYIDIDINNMDLTGIDPVYKREVVPFHIYKNNQLIELSEPVYADSIVVEVLDGGTLVPYALFTTGSPDDTAISKAKYAQNQADPGVTFTSNLVNSIIVTGYTGTEFTIYVTYQALYKDTAAITSDTIGPAYTPGLMRAVLNKLSYLTGLLPPLPNISEETVNTIQVLAEDLSGENPNNYIQDEVHLQVNTLANRFVVRPANGSFYKHDLVVKYNDTTLVEGIDYEVTGINLGKTRVTTNTNGVYDYILFTTPRVAGVVTISYRAFGGDICPLTVDQIKLTLANIIDYIKLGGFLTSASLQSHPIIISIIDRITNIENMLHIQAPITYTYTSSDVDVWSDIAHIKADVISGLVATRGNGQLRVRCEKYFSELKFNYDLSAARQLDVHILSNWSTSFESDGVAYYDNRICPKFRIVWDEDSVNSGIILQMSVTNKTTKNLNVEIQNSAGLFSNWELIPTDGNPLPDGTTSTTLPDDSTWGSVSPNCRVSNVTLACGKGYTIFTGTIPTNITDSYTFTNIELDDPQDNSDPIQEKNSGLSIPVDITGTDIVMSEVDAICFKMYDRFTGTTITKVSDYIDVINDDINASVMYFIPDLCCAECILTKTESGYTLSIGSSTGTNSLNNNRFDFKQIDILFKGAISYD